MSIDKCIRHQGIIYCWNPTERAVEKYTMTMCPLNECPEIVVLDLMRLVYEEQSNKEN